MESSSPFPQPNEKPQLGRRPDDAELIELLDTDLRLLARTHPGVARRLAMSFMASHKGELRPPSLAVVRSAQVIPIGTPFLLEERPGPCPRCEHRLVERSRVGASVYYTCMTAGCLNEGSIFLELLGTGDD